MVNTYFPTLRHLIALSLVFFLTTGVTAQTQEPSTNAPDTVSTSADRLLDELIVEGSAYTPVTDGIAATPSRQDRNAAYSGLTLLEHMGIPTLRINADKSGFTTDTGERVTYFINGVQASQPEVAALRPKDVIRVEVLRHPSDIRYHGVPAAVDFIVRTYDYSGYVNAQASQRFITDQGWYSLAGVYQQNGWKFQLTGGDNYWNKKHDATDVNSYDFPSPDGERTLIERHSYAEVSGDHFNNWYGAFKASRSTGRTYFHVQGGVSEQYSSERRTGNDILTYGADRPVADSYDFDSSSRVLVPFANAEFDITLPAGNTIWATITTTWTLTRNRTEYTSAANPDILNRVRENSFRTEGALGYQKTFGGKSRLMALASVSSVHINFRNSGDTEGRQTMDCQDLKLMLQYSLPLSATWNLSASAAAPVSVISTGEGRRRTETQYTGNISVNGSIAGRHFLGFSFTSFPNMRLLSAYNDVERRETEFDGVAGNDGLKLCKVFGASLSYTWMPSGMLNLNIGISWDHRSDDYVLQHFLSDGVIYNRYINSGNLDWLVISPRLSLTLLDGRLKLTPSATVEKWRHSGLYPADFWTGSGNLDIYWYPLQCLWANAGFGYMDAKTYGKGTGDILSYDDHWKLSLRAGFSKWNLSAVVSVYPLYHTQVCRKDFISENVRLASTVRNFNSNSVEISLSYTLPFGKKDNVRQDITPFGFPTTSIR